MTMLLVERLHVYIFAANAPKDLGRSLVDFRAVLSFWPLCSKRLCIFGLHGAI